MMTSSDGDGVPNFIRDLTPERFEVVFQLVKEIHLVPQSIGVAFGWESNDIDALQGAFRDVRGQLKDIPSARVRIVASGASFATPRQLDEASGEADGNTLFLLVPERLARGWGRFMEEAISLLGPRELFLRTGYQRDEIWAAVQDLAQS